MASVSRRQPVQTADPVQRARILAEIGDIDQMAAALSQYGLKSRELDRRIAAAGPNRFVNQWVGLLGDELVADEDRMRLHDRIRKAGGDAKSPSQFVDDGELVWIL